MFRNSLKLDCQHLCYAFGCRSSIIGCLGLGRQSRVQKDRITCATLFHPQKTIKTSLNFCLKLPPIDTKENESCTVLLPRHSTQPSRPGCTFCAADHGTNLRRRSSTRYELRHSFIRVSRPSPRRRSSRYSYRASTTAANRPPRRQRYQRNRCLFGPGLLCGRQSDEESSYSRQRRSCSRFHHWHVRSKRTVARSKVWWKVLEMYTNERCMYFEDSPMCVQRLSSDTKGGQTLLRLRNYYI